jgi:hypothetical protein
MSSEMEKRVAAAAAACGKTPEEFLKEMQDLLSLKRCRDIHRTPLFSAPVLKAISSV